MRLSVRCIHYVAYQVSLTSVGIHDEWRSSLVFAIYSTMCYYSGDTKLRNLH